LRRSTLCRILFWLEWSRHCWLLVSVLAILLIGPGIAIAELIAYF
jgi:hypothetical protein